MCGIAGIIKSEDIVKTGQIKLMTDSLAHRGPDGEGHWINLSGKVGFGHRRLSIIDLSDHAKQPMKYLSDRYTITFNGEIYNYIELRKDLLNRGYIFQSESDTEVLLALYDLKKERCLQDLDGMFAFAIWDEQEQRLFCARDRFGEKPFYYHHIPGKTFCFASEMKALWAIGIPRMEDPKMVAQFLKTGSLLDNEDLGRTFFVNIRQLDSAHFLILDYNININIKEYYSLNDIPLNESISKHEAAEKFYNLLTESVRLRLRSDVSVGSSLSGGLDSSSIVMLIDQLKGETTIQNTFSARFAGYHKDEGEYIHKVVGACKNVICNEVWPMGEQMIKEWDEIFYHQEEPFYSASIFAQWKVMEMAKQQGITVLLDGQGADEYLGGYKPSYKIYLQQLFYTNRKTYNIEREAYSQLRGNTIKPVEEEETLRMFMGRIKKKVLNQPMPYHSNSLREELKRQMMGEGLKVLLRYADRNAMAHSMEVRLPFLSHHLVDFVFSLPDHHKLYKGWTKMILREAMKNILPNDICWRVDKGAYDTPQEDWLGNQFFKDRIVRSREKCNDLFGKNLTDKNSDWNLLSLSNILE